LRSCTNGDNGGHSDGGGCGDLREHRANVSPLEWPL
jgi:hypothetical protein